MIIRKLGNNTVQMIHTSRSDSTAEGLLDLAIESRQEFLLHVRLAAAARRAGCLRVERDSLHDALAADRRMTKWERFSKRFERREVR